MKNVITTVTVLAVAGTIISGGLWMLKSQSLTPEGINQTDKFKKATMIFGGIAILGIGANYLTQTKVVKEIVK